MIEIGNFQAWVARAEEDYIVARTVLRRKKPLTYSGCFHAQQCAEKYLKAILVAKNQNFSKTHDLLLLISLCEQAGVIIPIDPRRLNTLSDYSIRVRYPGEDPTPTEAKEAVDISQEVRRFVKKILPSI